MYALTVRNRHFFFKHLKENYVLGQIFGYFGWSDYRERRFHFRSASKSADSNTNVISKTVPPMNSLDESQAKEVQSVLSLDIGLSSISFSNLSRNFELIDWGVLNLNRPRPYVASRYVKMLKDIVEQLPFSDVAVIENQSFYSRTENPSLFPFVLHNRITEAALHALLLQRGMRTITIDPNLVRKFFDIRKGKKKNYYSPSMLQVVMEERAQRAIKPDPKEMEEFITEHKASVGSQEIVLESLQQRRTESILFFNNISGTASQVSLSLQQAQFYLGHVNKSDLGDSLLQGLAFLEMEVFRINYLQH